MSFCLISFTALCLLPFLFPSQPVFTDFSPRLFPSAGSAYSGGSGLEAIVGFSTRFRMEDEKGARFKFRAGHPRVPLQSMVSSPKEGGRNRAVLGYAFLKISIVGYLFRICRVGMKENLPSAQLLVLLPNCKNGDPHHCKSPPCVIKIMIWFTGTK